MMKYRTSLNCQKKNVSFVKTQNLSNIRFNNGESRKLTNQRS
jgi:hypothetical protein